jgi:predicted ATPase
MFIKSLQIENYKSYENSNIIEFSPGINVIIGSNNSGKTALLEALTLELPDNPHRSIKTLPNDFSQIHIPSSAFVELSLEKSELKSLVRQISAEPIGLRLPDAEPNWPDDDPEVVGNIGKQFSEWLNKDEALEISLTFTSDPINEINGNISGFFDSEYCSLIAHDRTQEYMELQYNSDGNLTANLKYEYTDHDYGTDVDLVDYGKFRGDIKRSITYRVFDLFRSKIYRFYAERLNIDKCECGYDSTLYSDASNLAEVINLLATYNPIEFNQLNELISIIFPSIQLVSSVKISDNIAELRVWGLDAFKHNRPDLAMPLSACGTGIGQVIAILYVIVMSRVPKTIIIDEPQSFLHPGAAKKLIEILKRFSQHQYFIATHSPMLISAADPSRIIQLEYDGCQTKISSLDSAKAHDQKMILAEVGVKLSDVFGFDNILWVEGQTEEQCFPMIFEKVAKKSLKGTTLLRVQTTGQLEGKNAELIFDLYKRLSGGQYLLPPTIGFILDSEGKTQIQMDDLGRKSQNSIVFLPRRMYENYLLNANAIADVLNDNDPNRESPVLFLEVEEWIDKKKQAREYLKKDKESEISDAEWIERVDAANLLKSLFNHFTETRVSFKKPRHPLELTSWLVKHSPDFLSELSDFLIEKTNI